MEEIIKFKIADYSVQNNTSLKVVNLKTIFYGTESLTDLTAKIQNLLPNKYKELKHFQCLSQKFETGLQINALVECAKTIGFN